MGYYMEQRDHHFQIAADDQAAALDALRQWETHELEQYPQYRDLMQTPLGNAETLMDALGALDWEAQLNEQGDIVGLIFYGEKLHEEDAWLEALAPYVVKGSYLTMLGEDGQIWRWYFDGTHCITCPGKTVFPDLPAGEE